MKTRGFTLLEMAIAIIIIGLIMGGILIGRSMIRVAELERIMDAKTQLLSSVNLFQSRFGQWPGDYDNLNDALRDTGGNPLAGGDGNGIISYTDNGASDRWQEVENVYAHLGASGMIGTTYGPATLHIDPAGGGPFLWNVGADAPQGPDTGTVFWVGAQKDSFYGRAALSVNTIMLTGIDYRQGSIRLEDAMALDAKYDDGVATTGEIRAYQPTGGIPGGNTCVTTIGLPATAAYLVNPADSNKYDCVIELGTF